MLKLSLKPKAVWFDGGHELFDQTEIGSYPREDRETLRFLIEPVHPDELDKLRSKHTKTVHKTRFVNRQRVNEPTEEVDADAIFEETVDLIVKDWDGFADDNGNPHECQRDVKVAIARTYPALASAWIVASREAAAEADRQRREQEKNLPSSPEDTSGE